MVRGELYDPHDAELVRLRHRARDLCQDLNATREAMTEEQRRLLMVLFGRGGDTVWLQPPFFCDYGANILLGERVFFNFNCVVLDVAPVTIGDHTMLGPAVQVYTATHPFDAGLPKHVRERAEILQPLVSGVLAVREHADAARLRERLQQHLHRLEKELPLQAQGDARDIGQRAQLGIKNLVQIGRANHDDGQFLRGVHQGFGRHVFGRQQHCRPARHHRPRQTRVAGRVVGRVAPFESQLLFEGPAGLFQAGAHLVHAEPIRLARAGTHEGDDAGRGGGLRTSGWAGSQQGREGCNKDGPKAARD